MRQPRTFSERLALLNKLNKRQIAEDADEGSDAGTELVEEDSESESDAELGDETGLGGEDSESESDNDLDSDAGDSLSDSDSESEFDGEDEPAGTGAEETAPALETPTASAPLESQPIDPSRLAESPSAVAPDPATDTPLPSVTMSQELSTSQQVVSQITSTVETDSAPLSETTPAVFSSLARDEVSTETVTDAGPTATSGSAAEMNSSEDTSASLSGGQVGGIIFGAAGGLGILIALGIFLFKWRKRHNASVYDRPPPPGVHDEDEKWDSVAPIVQVEQLKDGSGDGAAHGSADRRVSSWIRGTASRSSPRTLTAPAPVFFDPRDIRRTGSEA